MPVDKMAVTQRVYRSLGAIAAVCTTLGCSTVTIESVDGFGSDRTYAGIVTLRAPFDRSDVTPLPRIRQLDVTTVGVRLRDGVSLGYMRDRLLAVPIDCRLVIVVRSDEALRHATRVLQAAYMEREKLCIAETLE